MMRENGTIGEKNRRNDAEVWAIVAQIRRLDQVGHGYLDNNKIRDLIARLKDDYNFEWHRDLDQGSYTGSGVVYDADRTIAENGDHRTDAQRAEDERSLSPDEQGISRWGDDYREKPQPGHPNYRDDSKGGGPKDKDVNNPRIYGGVEGRKNAWEVWAARMETYGFDQQYFKDVVTPILKNNRSPDGVLTALRQDKTWNARFAGNKARVEMGLLPLDPSQYVATEEAMLTALRNEGLPATFYDDKSDFADFIGKNISPEQVAERAAIAGEYAINNNPTLWKELKSRGLGKGDLAAYVLDPDRAMPAIERKLGSADIGVAMKPAGLDVGGKKKGNKFENRLYDKGIAPGEAGTAAQKVAGEDKGWSMLAGRNVDDKIQVKEELGIGGKKVKKWKDEKKHLASEERARFNEKGGGGTMFGNYNL